MNIINDLYNESAAPLQLEGNYKIKSILLEGDWNEEIQRFIQKNQILGLYYNHMKGSNALNFNFLEKLKNFELLDIISTPIDDLSQIIEFSELKVLSLQCHIKKTVNFSFLQNLEKCYIPWLKGGESIFQCENIRFLSLDSFQSKILPNTLDFEKLEQLTMYRSDLSNLSAFKNLRKLKKLSLLNCKKLRDINDLRFLENIEWLVINGSKQIEDFYSISNLKNLKVLDLSNTGKIPSVAFINTLSNLQAFAFPGPSTYIEDENLQPLTKLPKLSMLMFAQNKNYSHKLIKNWNWNNFNQPDTLLIEQTKKPHFA